MLYPFLVFHCRRARASASGSHEMKRVAERVKVKGRVWSQRLPFKCEETVLCGISMRFLIFSSVCLPLPVSPTATITCHPSRRLSLSSLSTLPLLFSLAHPCLSPVILFIPFFLPFCRGSPPPPPPRYSRSHLTSFRSSVHSLALPQGGCCGDR